MKKMILLFLAIAFVISGCATTTTLQTETDTVRKVPTWYLEHDDRKTTGIFGMGTEYIYSVAEDVSPSKEMGIRKATLKAKAKLADKVVGELTNRTEYTYKEAGTPAAPIAEVSANDSFVNEITKSILNMYAIEKRYIVYNPELRNYRVFVLIKIAEEDLARIPSQLTAARVMAAQMPEEIESTIVTE